MKKIANKNGASRGGCSCAFQKLTEFLMKDNSVHGKKICPGNKDFDKYMVWKYSIDEVMEFMASKKRSDFKAQKSDAATNKKVISFGNLAKMKRISLLLDCSSIF